MVEVILMAHVMFGMLCIVTSVWVFVDVLNVGDANIARIRLMSLGVAIFFWLSFLIGGYWYVVHYGADKAFILKGSWPFAHKFFMETKEHLVIMLLLLVTYLPIVASNNLTASKEARTLALWVVGLIALIAFVADGSGAIIAIGAKLGLLPK